MSAHHLIPDLQPIGWLGVILTTCAISAYAFKAIRAVVRVTNRAGQFFDDWQGEPARLGFAARPGIPERIERLEQQLNPNGGMSLRDQTNRIEDTLNKHILDSTEGH
jgi:hypothetical protein